MIPFTNLKLSLLADERGSVAIQFGMLFVPLLGFAGLAADYGRALHTRQELQSAADAAALAAAGASRLTTAERITIATQTFLANYRPSAFGSDIEPDVVIDNGTVSVTAAATVVPAVAKIIHPENIEINVSAKAASGTGGSGAGGQACVLTLEESDYGIKLNGGGDGSRLIANCGVYVNSDASDAIFGNSKGHLTSSFTCVVGDYDTDPTYSPTPTTGCPTMADPFADLVAPSASGCTYSNKKVNSNKTAILSPGVYCGGIDIGSSATVTFNPGTYVIKNGQFKIGSSAAVTGTGVFFYLTSGNARIDWGSSASITFTAPADGTYKGMLIWAAEALNNAHRIGCHATSVLQGAVYSPGTEIDIQSSGQVFASADWTVWVVKQLQMSSHAELTINANYATSETPLPDVVLSRMVYTPGTLARLTE